LDSLLDDTLSVSPRRPTFIAVQGGSVVELPARRPRSAEHACFRSCLRLSHKCLEAMLPTQLLGSPPLPALQGAPRVGVRGRIRASDVAALPPRSDAA
jgi:hypothetical protein